MRILFLFAFLIWTFAAEPTTKQAPRKTGRDALTFRNGDVLFGSLTSIDAENGIKWTRADARNEFHFNPERISEVDFANAANAPSQVSSNFCSVQLSNGDQCQGELVYYDGAKLKLNTWFAGELEFPREAVALVVPLGLPKPTIFAGPSGLEGWTMGKVNAGGLVEAGEWIYQNNALYAFKSASIARDVHLPDSCSMQFDLEWRGFFHIAVALYTEYLHPVNLANKETEPKFGGFYSMQINPFSANLLPVKQTDPLHYLGQASLQTLAQKNGAHVDIRVSKSKRVIALLIDGVLVKQWVDTEDFAGTGTAIRFVHQGQGAVKLTNLKIIEWDGQFEEPVSITPNKSQDLARLKNGDRVFGNVKALRDGKLTIEAAGTTLDVPVTRVKQVELASQKPFNPRTNTNTVRAFFNSGSGSMTFDLHKWTGEELKGESANFGSATFKPNAFSRLVFDLSASVDSQR
jgi:hypothetical protein